MLCDILTIFTTGWCRILQVHYGQSNDIFVNPSDKKEESSQYAYSDVSSNYDKVEGSLVQQPYYPFPKEGKDQAYLATGYECKALIFS